MAARECKLLFLAALVQMLQRPMATCDCCDCLESRFLSLWLLPTKDCHNIILKDELSGLCYKQLGKQGPPPYEVTMAHNDVECKVKSIGEGCYIGKGWIGYNSSQITRGSWTLTIW